MNHLGKETYLEVGDKKYRLSRYTRAVWRDVLNWANTQLPNYVEAVKTLLALVKDNKEMENKLVEKALDATTTARSLNSPEVQQLLASPEGVAYTFARLLHKYHPELSEDEAWEVYELAMAEHGIEYVQAKILESQGVVPKKNEDAPEKAQA